MGRLSNKIILITGGARGQGAAEAALCVAEGAIVHIGDMLDDEGERLAAELGFPAPSTSSASSSGTPDDLVWSQPN